VDWASWFVGQSGQAPALHHRFLLQHLDAVSSGVIDRLMVLMPPGSAKTTYASLLFPIWWFGQHPNSSIIATSHTASLAEDFGRQARDIANEYGNKFGDKVRLTKQAAHHWQVSGRGQYFAAGIRGPLTGRRADLVIIDDPIKSQAEADSPRLRERLWNWYRYDLTTRLKPGGRIVLIMTRWHEDDLAGRLLAQGLAEWEIIQLPAVAEQNDPLGRTVGSALWPEWEDETALRRRRRTVGEQAWFSLFQQTPRPIWVNLFKVACIDILDRPPTQTAERTVRAWDLAATVQTSSNDPDWTVGVKLMRDERDRVIVLDVVRLRGSPHDVEALVVETAHMDGLSVPIGLPKDPGQAGIHQVSSFARQLIGYCIDSSRETGSKFTRAWPVATQIEAHNFALVRGDWNHAFMGELASFPSGDKDDQVDALSRAFTMLFDTRAPARRLLFSFLAR
jgi:predicted phage terminase large subunit-like protein